MAGHDHVEVTKEIIDCSPPLSEACAIQRIVIVQAHRHEFGLLRDRPDASLLLRARWIAQTRRRSALQMTRRNSMAHLSKKQRQERLMEEFLRRIREASPGLNVSLRSFHPDVSVFPDRVVGSTCALSFWRIARRSLALRPAHSRCHQFVTR